MASIRLVYDRSRCDWNRCANSTSFAATISLHSFIVRKRIFAFQDGLDEFSLVGLRRNRNLRAIQDLLEVNDLLVASG